MYRVIIVDDEPLILAGIASLITWEEYDCTIIGKATNGPSAFDMIMELKPDIVITDIRMPVLNGLELVEKCKDEGCTFSFIVLTNLEEFHLVRKALSLGASDYLVKLDLNEEALAASLARAKEACELLVSQKQHQLLNDLMKDNQENASKNYLSQLLLSGNNPEVPDKVRAEYPDPFLLLFSISPINIAFETDDDPYDFHQISKQLMDILGGIATRTFRCHTLLEFRTDTYLLAASLKDGDVFETVVSEFCQKMTVALKTYFEFSAVFGVSRRKSDISHLKDALSEAHMSRAKDFNINIFKKDLSAAIAQNDSDKLAAVFGQIITLFKENQPGKDQAASACINLYTYLYSYFESADNSYGDIFPYAINVAGRLYQFNSLADILTWLQSFCSKLCRLLNDRKSTRSDKLVEQARAYVDEHYMEKLTLADIADCLNISAGHLSNTFKKLTGSTLSDYIATVKIEHAKELIDTHQYLMYEISDMLGFDNPYYFSKVFKKVTGISPREHENRTPAS